MNPAQCPSVIAPLRGIIVVDVPIDAAEEGVIGGEFSAETV
jgi:hypothetical protein